MSSRRRGKKLAHLKLKSSSGSQGICPRLINLGMHIPGTVFKNLFDCAPPKKPPHTFKLSYKVYIVVYKV